MMRAPCLSRDEAIERQMNILNLFVPSTSMNSRFKSLGREQVVRHC